MNINNIKTSLDEVIVIEQTINDLLFWQKMKMIWFYQTKELLYFDEIIDESINEIKILQNKSNKIEFELIDTIEFNGYSSLFENCH